MTQPVEPEMWTVEQIDALHSLREMLGMPTPSSPLSVLEMAISEIRELEEEARDDSAQDEGAS